MCLWVLREAADNRLALGSKDATATPNDAMVDPLAGPVVRSRQWEAATVYAITSLSCTQARPACLADLLRGHWQIENGLHHVRDTTFTKTAPSSASAPAVMACLRNLAIGILHRAGHHNVAVAVRYHARDPYRPRIIFGITPAPSPP